MPSFDKSQKLFSKYNKIKLLGLGKEGKTYLVSNIKGKQYAMKTFKPRKSSRKIYNEVSLQKRVQNKKICPKILDYNLDEKYIVMEKMDKHLLDVINSKGLNKKNQLRLIDIFKILDEKGVFHDDANLANYMIKNDEIYIIDFGYAKKIDEKLIRKLGTDNPNLKLMTIGLILKLKELQVPEKSYKYLIKHVSKVDIQRFNLI